MCFKYLTETFSEFYSSCNCVFGCFLAIFLNEFAFYSVRTESEQWKLLKAEAKPLQNIMRWMNLMEMQQCVVAVLGELPAEARNAGEDKSTRREEKTGRKEEGKFVDLPGAEIGKVVVRFPPEASG